MTFVSLQEQITSNRRKSMALLCLFPLYIVGLIWSLVTFGSYMSHTRWEDKSHYVKWAEVNSTMGDVLPWVLGGVALWFVIAYFYNVEIVRKSTGARSLSRKEAPRIYNIVENLALSVGMPTPKIDIIETNEMNAYACGIDKDSYTVAVTQGLMNRLTDEQLEAVMAHELSHIRNKDTQLTIITIVFVGIMYAATMALYGLCAGLIAWGASTDSRKKDDNGGNLVMLGVGLMCTVGVMMGLAYLFTLITHFAISRKREFLADAGSAEMTSNPWALADALKIISSSPALSDTAREDVAQLYICHKAKSDGCLSGWFSSLFNTHPDTDERIRLLRSY